MCFCQGGVSPPSFGLIPTISCPRYKPTLFLVTICYNFQGKFLHEITFNIKFCTFSFMKVFGLAFYPCSTCEIFSVADMRPLWHVSYPVQFNHKTPAEQN